MSTAKAHLERLPRGLQFALALGFVALAAFPFVATDFYAQMVARMMILAIFAMSLDLLLGVTGLVSLGHAAFFGLALAGIRVNEHRMRAMGFGTFGYKLAAFTLAGALAGLAGYLWGAQTGFVNPELMGFHMSAHAIMMVILGGMGNFAGAIVGAFAFEYLLHAFKDLPAIGGFNTGKHWQLWMGLFIVLVVAFAPRGLLGWLASALRRKEPHRD